jgi:hypothetical protein
MHQPRHLLEFSSQTEVRFLLLVKDTGYTDASRVVLHRGSGAVLLPRDQGCNVEHSAANQGSQPWSVYNNSQLLTRDKAAMLDMLQPTRVRVQQ